MKTHLASMYRCFIEKNEIEIRYNNEKLKYQKPEVLQAPYFRDIDEQKKNPKKLTGQKNLNLNIEAKEEQPVVMQILEKQHQQKKRALHYLEEID